MKTLEIVRNIDGQEVEKLNENPQDNLNKIQDLENVNPGSAVMPTGMIQGTPSFKIFLESAYKRTVGMFHLLVNGRSKIQLQKWQKRDASIFPSSVRCSLEYTSCIPKIRIKTCMAPSISIFLLTIFAIFDRWCNGT